jgi:enoyl-CoA hydratase/carnithine racemase
VPEKFNRPVANAKQILLARPSPHYWRITLDHPPLNIFGPDTIPQLNEVITALETDKQVKVVVFDSAVEGFFLTHYDFVAKLEDTRLPPGPTGLQPGSRTIASRKSGTVQLLLTVRALRTAFGCS